MPKVGETDLDVLKRDAFMFLIFENSMNISEETLTILNREMLDFIRSIFAKKSIFFLFVICSFM